MTCVHMVACAGSRLAGVTALPHLRTKPSRFFIALTDEWRKLKGLWTADFGLRIDETVFLNPQSEIRSPQFEEAREVLAGDAAKPNRFELMQVRDDARRFDDARRLVAPPAKRDGREKRAIGFDEQTCERHTPCDVAQGFGVFEGDVARKRDHETQFKRRFSQGPTTPAQ